MEFLSVVVFPILVVFGEGNCKLKDFLSVYLMVPNHLIFFFICVEKSCYIFKSAHQQQGLGSVIADV